MLMQYFVAFLMAWIVGVGNVDCPKSTDHPGLPTVIVSEETSDIMAADYDPATDTITIYSTPAPPFPTLVHEVTHACQHRNGKLPDVRPKHNLAWCKTEVEIEVQAMTVENIWLAINGGQLINIEKAAADYMFVCYMRQGEKN